MRRAYTILLEDEVADALLCAAISGGLLRTDGTRPCRTIDRVTSAGVELAREVQRERDARSEMQAP